MSDHYTGSCTQAFRQGRFVTSSDIEGCLIYLQAREQFMGSFSKFTIFAHITSEDRKPVMCNFGF